MDTLHTPRMALVPATAELVRLELGDRAALGQVLQAEIPADWPPELMADALPWFAQQLEDRAQVGWLCWYGVVRGNDWEPSVLAASGGFTGPPSEDGTVEIGYSVLTDFQGRGLATEMVGALTAWAFARPAVRRVVAETHEGNAPSLRLLRTLGFSEHGPGREPDHLRFARSDDQHAVSS